MTSLIDAESVLTVDVGSVNTRVLLFDVVEGQYHFISAAMAPSTTGFPFRDISEGFHVALQRLQEITGRTFVDREYNLILPSQPDGTGVDRLAVSFSVGEDINMVTMGLLSDVSLQSADRLAGSTYGRVIERIGLNDSRRPEVQLDAILQARPDVIIVSGGTEKGATRSVFKLIELAGMACKVLPKENRPVLIYCGNGALSKRVKETLGNEIVAGIAPNIRPTIDQEDLDPAQTLLARAVAKVRMRQINGLEQLSSISSVPLTPGVYGFGRMMRFLSDLYDPVKGVLGVDVGASTTTMAVGKAGSLQLNVLRPLGLGTAFPSVLQGGRIEELMQWISHPLSEAAVRDYIYQKSIRPGTLPLNDESLSIEQAAARLILSLGIQRMQERWPGTHLAFDLVILSGAVFANAPTPAQSLLMALDGIQPVGVGVFLLDPYSLTQSLGTIAASNTVLPVQVKDSGVYVNLGTVISPVSDAKPGTVILKIHMTIDGENENRIEIKQGSLTVLPIRNGQVANLTVETLSGTVLDPARPRMKTFKVIGGACGVVVDSRGRSLTLPADQGKRLDLLHRWERTLEDRRMV
jgi:hypothetical protein